MDAEQAISQVTARIRSDGLDYPTDDLTAARFEGGWCVYAPVMIDDDDEPEADPDHEVTRSVFLVGGSGRIQEVTSTEPPEDARRWFEEACIWFTAEEPDLGPSNGPSHPDLGGDRPRRQRPPAAYDHQAVDAFAQALTGERDFAGWLADRLRELADLLGGSSRLVARRPRADHAEHVTELARPDDDEPTSVWRTWPAVDPASPPAADTTGWLLTPGVTTCEYLEALEPESDAAGRLADAVAARVNQAPPWRACRVAELVPPLVALRGDELADADLDAVRAIADDVDALLLTPDDPDVAALLRYAVDAQRHERDTIDIDAAATAAYRRVLDRLDLQFENYWYEAMFDSP
jgi:hypothetical protein